METYVVKDVDVMVVKICKDFSKMYKQSNIKSNLKVKHKENAIAGSHIVKKSIVNVLARDYHVHLLVNVVHAKIKKNA